MVHECSGQSIDGNDAEMEIKTDGHIEITDINLCNGIDVFLTSVWTWCPYCGVKLDDSESETASKKSDCKCINVWHGRCMNCGRPAY